MKHKRCKYAYIYHFSYILEYLKIKYVLCAYVGLVHPRNFTRNRRHPQPEERPTAAGRPIAAGGPSTREAERVLRQVERNFTSLTRTVPMAEIKDLPPSMQPHVVGAPQMWVRLFQHLENVVDYYNRAHRP
jgi:hypothetical protein